jgi:crossover junction endodeoxyribonuclease RusA
MIELELPWPPSMNRMWRNVGGRTLLCKPGREYRQLVALLVRERHQIAERIAVTITACPPDRRRRDLDNMLKAPLDALTFAGVWLDDSQIDRLTIARGDVCKGGRLLVAIHYDK